jgi:1,4-alpha-glucan branching enzyme
MTRGYLAMVLHAHLPYVRHPEHEHFLEERWFYEAVTECYLPLLWVLERLLEDSVDFRLTFNLSPTLIAMFNDDLLRQRYVRHLEMLNELAEHEVEPSP